MINEAWDYRSDMRCCVRQLQVLLVKRDRARNGQGEQKGVMVPAFSFQDLDKRGGLIDQAFFMLEGVEVVVMTSSANQRQLHLQMLRNARSLKVPQKPSRHIFKQKALYI